MPMETLAQAIARLEQRGFRDSFRAEERGLRALRDGRSFEPEELVTEEVVRFEGASNPDDASILMALRTADGSVRGTLVTSFGPGADPEAAELVRRLPAPSGRD